MGYLWIHKVLAHIRTCAQNSTITGSNSMLVLASLYLLRMLMYVESHYTLIYIYTQIQ